MFKSTILNSYFPVLKRDAGANFEKNSPFKFFIKVVMAYFKMFYFPNSIFFRNRLAHYDDEALRPFSLS